MFGHEAKLAALINRDPPQVPNEQELVAELRAKLGPGAHPDKLLFQIRSARGKTHWAVNSYLREVMTSSVPGQEDFLPSKSARMAAAAASSVSSSCPSACKPLVSSEIAKGSNSVGAAKHIDGGDAAAAAATATVSATDGSGPAAASSGSGAHNYAGAEFGHQANVQPRDPTSVLYVDQSQELLTKLDAAATLSFDMAKGDDGGNGNCNGTGTGLGAPSLDSLPVSLLEAVFRFLDYRSLCAAAMTSRTMSVAAAAESLWSSLYASRWGRLMFPTEPNLGASVPGQALGMGPALGSGKILREGSGPGGGIGPELAVQRLGLAAATPAEGGPSSAAGGGGFGAVDGPFPLSAAAGPVLELAAVGLGGEAAAAGLPSLLLQWRSGQRYQRQQQQRQQWQQLPSLVPDPSGGLIKVGTRAHETSRCLVSCGLIDGSSSGPGDECDRLTGSLRTLPAQTGGSEDGFAGILPLTTSVGMGHHPLRLSPSPSLSLSPPLQHQQPDFTTQSPLLAATTVTEEAATATQSRNSFLPHCTLAVRDEGAIETNPNVSRVERALQNASAAFPSICPAAAAVAVAVRDGNVAPLVSQALPAGCRNCGDGDGDGGSDGGGGGMATAIRISYRGANDAPDGTRVSLAGTHGNTGKDMPSPYHGSGAAAGCDKVVAAANAASKAMTAGAGGRGESGINGPSLGASSKVAAFTATSVMWMQSGSFRLLYRQQMSYLNTLRCPRCGGGSIVPIVYGFPSPKLMDGMRERRLILGGDHLIENCHVWGCNRCGASFHHFPYDRCEPWVSELARPQPQRPSHLPHYTYEL